MNEWCPVATVYNALKAGSIDGTDVEPHDHAVWRAMQACYRPNKGVGGDPLLTLFVSRLNQYTTEDKLQEVFSKYGDIRNLRLVRDVVTGFSKGYAFVEYKEERAVTLARQEAFKLVVDQHELFVDFEQERTLKGWVPRRLGGGLGGRKESGQLRFGGRDRPFRKPFSLPPSYLQDRPQDHRWEKRGAEREEWGKGRQRGERSLGRDSGYRDRREERDRGMGRREDQDRGPGRREERRSCRDKDYNRDRRDNRRSRDEPFERDSKRRKDDKYFYEKYREDRR